MKKGGEQRVTLFFRQLSLMLGSGINLHEALQHLEKGEGDPLFRRVLEDCVESVFEGKRFSEVIRRHPEEFEPLAAELVSVGEETGALHLCLNYLAGIRERRSEQLRAAQAALAYPACLFLVLIGVCCLFTVLVSPTESGFHSGLEGELPWPSMLLSRVSSVLTDGWLMLLVLSVSALVSVALWRAHHNHPSFRLWLHGCWVKLPIIGSLARAVTALRVIEVLKTCLGVGMGLVPALHNCRRVIHNEKLKADFENVNAEITRGESLGGSLARHRILPSHSLALVQMGEVSGTMDRALALAQNLLEEETRLRLDSAIRWLEPALLMVGGALAAFVAVATFLPIIELMTRF